MCLEVIKSSGQVFKCATTDPKTGVKNDAGKRTQSQQEMVTYDFLMKPTRTKLWIDEKRVKRFKRSMKKEEEVLSRFMEDTIKVHNQKKTTDLYGFLIKPTRTHRTANEEGNRQRRSIGTTGEETLKVDIGPKDSVSTLHRSKRT
ncbi:uncharacterized protein LOC125239551 [Leguminivora glycinivorella]|uniref:uncharacterized protein LOC125239551 n=1 Tax=Leguminivora glycinivorella TaxID=1035111 RepID=UPI00200FB6C7|nr:uncharacterized protein LOC125239551 [Leguminivora glycinivorella]